MMKPSYFTHTLIIVLFFIVGCGSCNKDKKKLKSHIIPEQTALTFRKDFLYYPTQDYHIPNAFMFKTSTFIEYFQNMSGIGAIRFYPAINTHGDNNPDSLTLIMVPVNSSDQKDNFTGDLYEYSILCPTQCSCPGAGPAPAPTEATLGYTIPTSWCITKKTIEDLITEGEKTGPVDGIRFYTQVTADGTMSLAPIATRYVEDGKYYEDLGTDPQPDVAEACMDGQGCCDPDSKLYHPTGKGKDKAK